MTSLELVRLFGPIVVFLVYVIGVLCVLWGNDDDRLC